MAVLTLLAIVTLSAIVFGGLDEEPDEDELVADVLNQDDIETLVATRNQTRVVDAESSSAETTIHKDRIWQRFPDQIRTEVVSTTEPFSAPGDTRVINGSDGRFYFADREQTIIVEDPDTTLLHYQGVEILDGYDIEYHGTERIGDRETHVVEIEPVDAAMALSLHVADEELEVLTSRSENDTAENASVTTTWWIDTETPFPIKERIEIHPTGASDGPNAESKTLVTTYEDVRFNKEIPEERFRFEFSDWTHVYDPSQDDSPIVREFSDAQDEVPFALSKPTIPDRFDRNFLGVYHSGDNTTALFYYRAVPEDEGPLTADERDVINIHITDRSDDIGDVNVVQQNVGELNGTVVTMDRWTTFVWYCEGTRYETRVDVADRAEPELAIEIGESMGC